LSAAQRRQEASPEVSKPELEEALAAARLALEQAKAADPELGIGLAEAPDPVLGIGLAEAAGTGNGAVDAVNLD
jgi:hypothetical protein